jgi:hypothetical protein
MRLIEHGREPEVELHTGLKKGRFHCHATESAALHLLNVPSFQTSFCCLQIKLIVL